ncbi:MAG: HEAT repeat domain-containing protein [Candidatus Marinimicrobia bacterium]|nr:HEAT repeat domain-containing protein [Candidatus Neomarinimicrobiota bacterium]
MPNPLNNRLKKQAVLYILKLLDSKKSLEFEKKMNQDQTLNQYVGELQVTMELTSQFPVRQPSENFLKTQRNLLRGRIDILVKEPVIKRIIRSFEQIFIQITPLFRLPAMAIVSSLIIGILAGRFLFTTVKVVPTPIRITNTTEERIHDFLRRGQLAAGQIEYVKNGPDKVVFHLKTEDEYVYSGGLDDALVKELLTYHLLNETNPGKRLKSIKFMMESGADESLMMVYVAVLLTDENPGVRLRAMEQLIQYPPNKIIRDASMKVLLEEENTAIRMGALRILANNPDERLVPVLQVVSRLDDNEFIREQAFIILSRLDEVSRSDISGE